MWYINAIALHAYVNYILTCSYTGVHRVREPMTVAPTTLEVVAERQDGDHDVKKRLYHITHIFSYM
jgi:hypothetical protein